MLNSMARIHNRDKPTSCVAAVLIILYTDFTFFHRASHTMRHPAIQQHLYTAFEYWHAHTQSNTLEWPIQQKPWVNKLRIRRLSVFLFFSHLSRYHDKIAEFVSDKEKTQGCFYHCLFNFLKSVHWFRLTAWERLFCNRKTFTLWQHILSLSLSLSNTCFPRLTDFHSAGLTLQPWPKTHRAWPHSSDLKDQT